VKNKLLLVSIASTFMMTGCANMTSIHRTFDTDSKKSTLIDAKQRAILIGERDGKTIICAEPSPDAFSAIAASNGITFKVNGDKEIDVQNAINEAVGSLALRTHSIQLLRDMQYRTCEAYLNYSIDKYQYELLLARQQRLSLAMMAIEQLSKFPGVQSDSITPTPPANDKSPDEDNKNKSAPKPSVSVPKKSENDVSCTNPASANESIVKIAEIVLAGDDMPAICLMEVARKNGSVKQTDTWTDQMCAEYLRGYKSAVEINIEHNKKCATSSPNQKPNNSNKSTNPPSSNVTPATRLYSNLPTIKSE